MTPLSSDANDLTPITPNMILKADTSINFPIGLSTETDKYRRRWRQIEYLLNVYWKRWHTEYLPLLQERAKWLHPQDSLRTGDLVILQEEMSCRNHWPLGRVTSTFPSSDGRVRSVERERILEDGVVNTPIQILRNESLARYNVKYKCNQF